MKKIIYTVILGNSKKLSLNEPRYQNRDWELICFTDRNIYSNDWKIVKVKCKDPLKKSREIKIRCDQFLDFDVCLYMDSQFVIKSNVDNFIKENLRNDFLLMKHSCRHCAYREARRCIKVKKGDGNIIMKQAVQYKKEGFPKKFGLYACGIMVRKNTEEVADFMKLWHDEIVKYTYRDQISLPYILWKNPINIDVAPFWKTRELFKCED